MGLGAETSILAKLHESLLRFAYDLPPSGRHLSLALMMLLWSISSSVAFVNIPLSSSNAMVDGLGMLALLCNGKMPSRSSDRRGSW